MIEQLKKILDAQGEEVSALLEVLSRQEEIKLCQYFDSSPHSVNNLEDVRIKFFALNALFIYIKNNPSIAKELNRDDTITEKLALKNYELATIVYQAECSWENYFYVSAYATLADKITLLIETSPPEDSNSILSFVLKFFIWFSLPVKSREDFNNRKESVSELEKHFAQMQQPENIHSEEQLYQIIAVSNLVSTGKKLQHYLLEGDGNNLPANINNEVANAIKVFAGTGNREWELICSLLRFVLHKHYENSVWTAANRFSFFKKFVNQQLEQDTFLLSLFPSQRAALQDILSSHQSTVISMPTSSGKTLLAELKILYTRSLHSNDCLCAYVLPTNALINQTVKRLGHSFPDLSIKQLLPYNHFDNLEKDLIGNQPDIIVSTPEKLNFLLKNDEANMLSNLRLVIIDEAHNISDKNRGSIWEFLLSNLKQQDSQLSYLLLTPFISNKDELAQWLGNNSSTARSIEWTPAKQYIAYHSLNSNKTKGKISKINYLPSARNSIIKDKISIDLGIDLEQLKQELKQRSINDVVRNTVLVEKYRKQKGCILVLCKGAKSAEKLATALAGQFDFSNGNDEQKEVTYAREVIRLELGSDHPLLNLLSKRIAFHHAKLPPMVKEAIENLVNHNLVKVLVATTTLAQGMNFPIKTVIFETLHVGGGGNTKELTYSDFWNIAGRAGRAYKDTEGHIVLGWQGGLKKTRTKLKSFVSKDIEAAISSLKAFFDTIDNNTIIDYDFIKDKPVAQNFLHYLNHLMNISHQYQLDNVNRQSVINILANSLYFKQNEFSEGFLETQEKVLDFSNQYIDLIRNKDKRQLRLADTLGITDISLSTIIGITQDNRPILSDCINQNDRDGLATIIDAIYKIPELKISLGRQEGLFNAELIAGILLDWINGKTISEIAKKSGIELNECSEYIFSRLKNYIPWGMAIYQKISNDNNELLPSYAFYGVKDEKSVKLSYIGVPRFALNRVKQLIKDENLYKDLSKLGKHIQSRNFTLEDNSTRNEIINQIIKQSVF